MARPDSGKPTRMDSYAHRERLSRVDEAIWFGTVRVEVNRERHLTWWRVSGCRLTRAPGRIKEDVAAYIRSAAGLPPTDEAHEFVWLQVWHARNDLRGGLTPNRSGTVWEGIINVVSD